MSNDQSEKHEQAQFDQACLLQIMPQIALLLAGSSALCALLLV